jgi:hypothetical protein
MILFTTQNVCAVHENLGWLNNVTGVYLVQGFLDLNWSAGFWTFLQVAALSSHWLGDFANFTPSAEDNDQYSANQS